MTTNKNGFAHLGLIGIVLLVLVAGAGALVYVRNNDDQKSTTNSESLEVEYSLTDPLPDDLLSAQVIEALVKANTPDRVVASIELENEDGLYLYKVKLTDGTYLYYNAQTGETVAKQSDDDSSAETNEAIPAGFIPTITFNKAREIALNAKPDGTIRKIELELEEGVVIYSVRFTDDSRIDVDATSSAIVRQKSESESSSQSSSETEKSSDSSSSDSSDDSPDSPENESEDDNSGSNSGSNSSGSGSSGGSDDN